MTPEEIEQCYNFIDEQEANTALFAMEYQGISLFGPTAWSEVPTYLAEVLTVLLFIVTWHWAKNKFQG